MNNIVFRIDDQYAFLTKDLLAKEYIENKLTDKQIAQKYNIRSKVTIWRRRKFFGIGNSTPTKSNQNARKNREFNISREDAVKYLSEGLTYPEIAEKMGCSRMVAYRRMKEMGLIEDQSQAQFKLRWHEEITEQQTKFLLGCLLGDGNITPRGMFQCSHSHKQLEYIKYKKGLLGNLLAPDFELIFNTVKNHQNGKTYYSYYMRTMNNENLKKIYDIFYIDRVKIFPYEYLIQSNFDTYSLAVWYMDDGSRHENSARIHTLGYKYEGNLKIAEFLYKKFGIIGRVSEAKREGDNRWFINLNVENADKFFSMVAPHILPHFQYKLPEKYRSIPS